MLSNVIENPIFVRSLQVERRRSVGLKGWTLRYLPTTLLLFCPLLLSFVCEMYSQGLSSLFRDGKTLDLVTACVGLATFLLPVFVVARSLNGTFGVFSQEHEKQTLDSMLGTRLSADEILVGKLAGGIWPIWREWIVAAPFMLGFGLYLGHPGPALVMILLGFASAVFFGLLGLWASAGAKSSSVANRKASTTTLFIFFGGPVLSLGLSILTGSSGSSFQMLPLLTSPLVTSTSMMMMASQADSDGRMLATLLGQTVLFVTLGCAFYLRARRQLKA